MRLLQGDRDALAAQLGQLRALEQTFDGAAAAAVEEPEDGEQAEAVACD